MMVTFSKEGSSYSGRQPEVGEVTFTQFRMDLTQLAGILKDTVSLFCSQLDIVWKPMFTNIPCPSFVLNSNHFTLSTIRLSNTPLCFSSKCSFASYPQTLQSIRIRHMPQGEKMPMIRLITHYLYSLWDLGPANPGCFNNPKLNVCIFSLVRLPKILLPS